MRICLLTGASTSKDIGLVLLGYLDAVLNQLIRWWVKWL
jgi:hypothetical protein